MTSSERREHLLASAASRLAMVVHFGVPVVLAAIGVGTGLAALGVPEVGVAVALITVALLIASCWRIALLAADGGLVVRNMSGTYQVRRADVVGVQQAEEVPWYWPMPMPITPMVELRLRDGTVLRLHATALPGRKRRAHAAEFIADALKISQHRLRSYVEGLD
jgi:hypothetical protein